MSALICVYDLACSPPTFDFVGFLIAAEQERLRHDKDSLRILIVAGPNHGFRQDNLPPHDPAERRRMLDNIVIPMCSLLPSCESVEECDADAVHDCEFPVGWTQHHRNAHYGTDKLVRSWVCGSFPLTAGVLNKDNDLITITIRDAPYWPTRNSNIPAWVKLKEHLESIGANVLIMHDSDAQNSAERGAIYERARLNLFVGGGPHVMAASMINANCLTFKMCSKDAPACSPEFFEKCGFPVGSQIGRSNHRIVWADDDYETMLPETLKELEEIAPPTLRPVSKNVFLEKLNNERGVMLDQVKINMRRDLPWFDGNLAHGASALLVGGGPSLMDTIGKLRARSSHGGKIFSMNGTHDWLIERGLMPHYHVMLDSRQNNVEFVRKPHKDVKYIISAFCHPDVFDALQGFDVTLWLSDMEGMMPLVQDIKDKPVCLVGGGATVGMKTMYLTYLSGYRKFHFYGFDSSYRGEANHAYLQTMNDTESKVEIICAGKKFICAPWMAKQAQEWQRQARKLTGLGCEMFVHGDGLIPFMAQQMAKMAKAA